MKRMQHARNEVLSFLVVLTGCLYIGVGGLILFAIWAISALSSLAFSVAVIALMGDLINLWDVVSWL